MKQDTRRNSTLIPGVIQFKAEDVLSKERINELKAQYPGFYRLNKTVELSGKSRSQV